MSKKNRVSNKKKLMESLKVMFTVTVIGVVFTLLIFLGYSWVKLEWASLNWESVRTLMMGCWISGLIISGIYWNCIDDMNNK